jgi:hypothetical protein
MSKGLQGNNEDGLRIDYKGEFLQDRRAAVICPDRETRRDQKCKK